jgi:hypothetical protein
MVDAVVPRVSFDWLATLPSLAEESRLNVGRRAILSGLDSSDPDALEAKARQLYGLGDTKTAAALMKEALDRRELARKAASDQSYLQGLPGILQTIGGARNPGAVGGTPIPSPPLPDVFAPKPPGAQSQTTPEGPPSTVSSLQGRFGNWASLPVDQGVTGTVPQMEGPGRPLLPPPQQVGQEVRPPSPSEELLSRTEDQPIGAEGTPPPSQLTRLAGPLPGSGTAPLPGSPGYPPPAPRGPVVPPTPEAKTLEEQAYQDAQGIAARLAASPKGSNTTGLRALLGDALRRAKVPQDRLDWTMENADRVAEGLQPQSYGDYQASIKNQPVRYKAALEAYQASSTEERKAYDLQNTIDRMDSILKNPKMTSGAGTAMFEGAKAKVLNIKDMLVANGVPIPDIINKSITDSTSSVQLRQAFGALANSAVFAKLGSLGNQISEGDRGFVVNAFPSLEHSMEGNKLILDYYKEVARMNKELGTEIRKTFVARGEKASPTDLDEIRAKFWADPKNSLLARPDKEGKLQPTEFGKKMIEIANPSGGSNRTPGGNTFRVIE